jgi:DNA-binding transcriptional LysR family regulator
MVFMDKKQIEYFRVVAEELNFGRAAARLNLSQPALSMSIRKLETELDLDLLHRLARGVTLTDAGHHFLRHAHHLHKVYEEIHLDMQERSSGARGVFRIGFDIGVAHAILPDVIATVQDEQPQLSIRARTGYHQMLHELLIKGDLDVVIAVMVEDIETEIRQIGLYTDPLVAIARRGHPRLKQFKTLRSVAAEKWVTIDMPSQARDWLWALLRKNSLERPESPVSTDTLWQSLDIVTRTDLLAYAPRSTLRQRQWEGQLVELAVPEIIWDRRIGLAIRPDTNSPSVVRLINSIRRLTKSLMVVPVAGK